MSATDRIRYRLPRRTPGRWSPCGLPGVTPDETAIVVPETPHPWTEVAPKALNIHDAVLITELVNNAEALCDLADAARRVPDDGRAHGTFHAHEGMACDRCMVLWPCPTVAIRDALARLDGEDES